MTRLWSISGETLLPMAVERLNSEDRLEGWLDADIGLLRDDLLVIGRQVTTAHGGRIDLLAIDVAGALHVIELKRDRTPRDIVAQVLDYASWIKRLDTPAVHAIADEYWRKRGKTFSDAFQERFEVYPPEPLNTAHSMIIVASALDPASERIVEYLSQEHDVGINTAFFTVFTDGDRQFLAADWLMDQEEVVERTERKVRAPWTGYKFVNCGEGEHRSWEDMRKFGFVSAGQGWRYGKQMFRLSPGDKIYVFRTQAGYVGFGEVISEAIMVRDFKVDSERLLDLVEQKNLAKNSDNPDMSEYTVGVKWIKTVPVSQARFFKGATALPTIVFRLHDPATLAFLAKEFGS